MKIITISGKAGSGKSTAAEMLKRKLQNKGYSVAILNYGDEVKSVCQLYFDWNGEKDEAGRLLLQKVGTDIAREKDASYWVDRVHQHIKMFFEKMDFVIIGDARYPNEINNNHTYRSNPLSILIEKTNYSGLTGQTGEHTSENSLRDYEFDIYIKADDLEKLEDDIEKIVLLIGRK